MTQSTSFPVSQKLSGWGRYPVLECALQRPESLASLEAALRTLQPSLLMRGAGRSYGDAALNPAGYTLLTERLNRMLSFDPQTGVLHCEAGVTFASLLHTFVAQGWFPPVTPGTQFATLGGAVAADVHGKNHHIDGSLVRHIHSLTMRLASGEAVTCSRTHHSDLFWATVGGMGLTGVILEVALALVPIQSAYIQCRSLKAQSLEETLALFERYEASYQYSVAWIDCLAQGSGLGRSILMLGNHAQPGDLSPRQQANPLAIPHKVSYSLGFDLPGAWLNRATVGWFNQAYFHRQRHPDVTKLVDCEAFFYPLDRIHHWNRLYGKVGFVQYQCVVPSAASATALTELLELCSQAGRGSFLAVLKRLGPQEGWLSFPMSGYTLALDLPIKPGIWEFLEQLDQIVLRHQGRVYLAKDARLSPETFRRMYPAFPKWLGVKAKVDPHNRFTSALGQRLNLHKP